MFFPRRSKFEIIFVNHADIHLNFQKKILNLDRRGKSIIKVVRGAHENISRVSPVQLSLKLAKLRLLEVLCILGLFNCTISPRNA